MTDTASSPAVSVGERHDLLDLLEQTSSALNDRGYATPADFETYELMRVVAEQLAEIVGGQLLFGVTHRHYGPGSYPR